MKIFDIPSTITTDNIKPMAGSIRTYTIDFPYKKFGFQDKFTLGFFTKLPTAGRIFSKKTSVGTLLPIGTSSYVCGSKNQFSSFLVVFYLGAPHSSVIKTRVGRPT